MNMKRQAGSQGLSRGRGSKPPFNLSNIFSKNSQHVALIKYLSHILLGSFCPRDRSAGIVHFRLAPRVFISPFSKMIIVTEIGKDGERYAYNPYPWCITFKYVIVCGLENGTIEPMRINRNGIQCK